MWDRWGRCGADGAGVGQVEQLWGRWEKCWTGRTVTYLRVGAQRQTLR